MSKNLNFIVRSVKAVFTSPETLGWGAILAGATLAGVSFAGVIGSAGLVFGLALVAIGTPYMIHAFFRSNGARPETFHNPDVAYEQV